MSLCKDEGRHIFTEPAPVLSSGAICVCGQIDYKTAVENATGMRDYVPGEIWRKGELVETPEPKQQKWIKDYEICTYRASQDMEVK